MKTRFFSNSKAKCLKRALSIVLTAVLLAGMLTVTPLAASAAESQTGQTGINPIEGAEGSGTASDPVVVTDWDQFKAAMAFDGKLFVRVGKNIKGSGRGYVDGFANPVEVVGNITLDLNGKEVQKFNQIEGALADGRTPLQMLKVSGTLTLNDSSDNDGSLRTNTHIPDTIDYVMQPESALGRVITVLEGGKFIMNGGQLCPGRSQKHWCAAAFTIDYAYGKKQKVKKDITDRYDGNGRVQNNGTALLVNSGGEAVINGGELYGRGWSGIDYDDIMEKNSYITLNKMEAAVETKPGSKLTIYDGLFEGTNANIFNYNGGSVNIYGGKFNPRKTDKVIIGAATLNGNTLMPYRVVMNGHYGELGLPQSVFSDAFSHGAKLFDSNGNEITDYSKKSTDGSTIYIYPASPVCELTVRYEDDTKGPSGKIEWAEGSHRVLVADGGNSYFPSDAPFDVVKHLWDGYEWIIYDKSYTYADGKKNQYGFNGDYCRVRIMSDNTLDLSTIDLDKVDGKTGDFEFTYGHKYGVMCRQILIYKGDNNFYADSEFVTAEDFYIPKLDIPKVTLGNLYPAWTHVYGNRQLYDFWFTVSNTGGAETKISMAKVEKGTGRYITIYEAPSRPFEREVTADGIVHVDLADYDSVLTEGEINDIAMIVTTTGDDGLVYKGESRVSVFIPAWTTTSLPSYDESGEMETLTTLTLGPQQYVTLEPNVDTSVIKGYAWQYTTTNAITGASKTITNWRTNDLNSEDYSYTVTGLQAGRLQFVGYYDSDRTKPAFYGNTIQIINGEKVTEGYAYLTTNRTETTRKNPATVTFNSNISDYTEFNWYYINADDAEKTKNYFSDYTTDKTFKFPGSSTPYNMGSGNYWIGCTAKKQVTINKKTTTYYVEIDPVPIKYTLTPNSVKIGYYFDNKWLEEDTYHFVSQNDVGQLNLICYSTKSSVERINWVSSDESIVTVDENGVIRAVAPGTATVTANAVDADNYLHTASIKVEVPVSVIDLYVTTPDTSLKLDYNSQLTVKDNPYYSLKYGFNNTHWVEDDSSFPSSRYFDINKSYEAVFYVVAKNGYTLPMDYTVKNQKYITNSNYIDFERVDLSKLDVRIHFDDNENYVSATSTENSSYLYESEFFASYSFPVIKNYNHTYISNLNFTFDPVEGTKVSDLPKYIKDATGNVSVIVGEIFDVVGDKKTHIHDDDSIYNGHTYLMSIVPSIKDGNGTLHFDSQPNAWVNGELCGTELEYSYGIDELEPIYFTFTVGDPDSMCSEVWIDLNDPHAGAIAPAECDVTAVGGFEISAGEITWTGGSFLENGAFKGKTAYTATMTLTLDDDESASFFGLKSIHSNGMDGTLISQNGSTAVVRFAFPKTNEMLDYAMALPVQKRYELGINYTSADFGNTQITIKNEGTSTLSDIEIVLANDDDKSNAELSAPSKTILEPGESLTFDAVPKTGLGEGYYRVPYRIFYTSSINGLRFVNDDNYFDICVFKGGFGVDVVYGDANGDGDVTIDDVTYIQLYLVGRNDLSGQTYINSDVNHDGAVTIDDATKIQRYLSGAAVDLSAEG